jgi:hypothetical protein
MVKLVLVRFPLSPPLRQTLSVPGDLAFIQLQNFCIERTKLFERLGNLKSEKRMIWSRLVIGYERNEQNGERLRHRRTVPRLVDPTVDNNPLFCDWRFRYSMLSPTRFPCSPFGTWSEYADLKAARYFPGVVPKNRLKVLEKWLWSTKPAAVAILTGGSSEANSW